MRIVVKQSDGNVKEFQFTEGPIHIGRHPNSQIYLSDREVSRQHAVVYAAEGGKWMVEDDSSANGTFLNDERIERAEIKTGDYLRIADFTIEIDVEDTAGTAELTAFEDTLHLEATLTTPPHEILVRKPDASHAPAMRLPAKRLTDFSQATEAICKANSLEELLPTLLNIALRQFSAFHTWSALRDQPSGPMLYQTGKKIDGQAIEFSEIKLQEKINEAVEKGQSYVLPRVAAEVEEKERIRSAMIAPIMRSTGCFGVVYVDNAMAHEHYSLSDLDYLMLLAIITAGVLKSLLDF